MNKTILPDNWNGMKISIDAFPDRIFINFDKDGEAGGYVFVRLEDNEITVDIISAEGDVLPSAKPEDLMPKKKG